ncbi:MAG: L-threonine 3-dehydrogenase, partial [Firmicutes bacterium]|nr:L-threonine 3-dehydrogenase [Bacillota bacterium]
LIEAGKIDAAQMVTDRFPLSQFEEAFKVAAAGNGGKVVLYPGK